MQSLSVTKSQAHTSEARPSLIFFCELDSHGLHTLLLQQNLLHELEQQHYGIALATFDFGLEQALIVHKLNQHDIPVIAWLLLPPSEGFWFNVQNYPQAIERYRTFRMWALEHQLRFAAVGLDIEPPASEAAHIQAWGVRNLIRRFWLARENVLYPAAHAAFTDLIAEIHHDGYEVHTYQLPLLADDRRIGTTLIQRALDIVDLPADVEVLMCYSSLPVERIGNDLGGALIASYGSAADAIGIGSAGGTYSDGTGQGLPPLSWEALERDLLLAARYTDTIYLFSLEGCAERGLLPHIAALNWDSEPVVPLRRQLLVWVLRLVLAAILLLARIGPALMAWLGWGLAALLLLQRARRFVNKHPEGEL